VAEQFGNFQYEIYMAGLAGQKPGFPIAYRDLEAAAKERLTPEAYDYVAGGAGSEDTVRENLEAFRRWRIVPRMLKGAAERDLGVEIFGTHFPAPVLLAPVGVQSIIHHDEAEIATAKGAASLGVPIVLSTAASRTLEQVADAMGEVPRWYQLYWPNDPELCTSFVQRAEKAGYEAIVVTLDTTILAWRPRDLQRAYLPFLLMEGVANYIEDPVLRSRLEKPPEEDVAAAVMAWGSVFPNPALNWKDLQFLRDLTDLPILLKGIVHPKDAKKAVDHGVNGIVVSNHGGRQVDGAIASLDALPGVVKAVPSDFPVLLDSGVRTGSDAFKAIALGARAVLLGRPYVWGLALGGSDGVRHVLRSFLAELDLTVALAGYKRIADIGSDAIERVG
jgi:isopentenyl diphosphate isomerase/L-lactate dehydrogenase-like FMN-dependent dehydrogenase